MAAAELQVEVVYCAGPGQIDLQALCLENGATLADALRASGLQERHALPAEGLRVGVWGRLRPLDAPLRDRDRIEVYRALTVDPKEARRQRYKRHLEQRARGKAG